MRDKWKKCKEWQWAAIGLILFYLPFHIILTPDYWDDAVFGKVWAEWNGDLIAYTIERYRIHSSRITIELMLPILTVLPAVIWKILDLLMILLLYYDLRWLIRKFLKVEFKHQDLWLAALLCAFPFSIMAQTGWMATTANYLWVIALAGYAITRIIKAALLHEQITVWEIAGSGAAVLYSASFESMAAILLILLVGTIIFSLRSHNRIPAVVWVCGMVTVVLLIYILLCPGNHIRVVSDAENWMPDYFELSFLDKLRMGILSSFMHFVSIPSPLFFILNLLIGICAYRKETGKRILSLIPMALDICWTVYYLVNYLRGSKAFTYQVPTPQPTETYDILEQILLFVSVIVWFAVVLYFMYRLLSVRKAAAGTVILVLACIPEMAVGLTPTVIASILRTMIYLYMAMIIIIIMLCEEMQYKEKTARKYINGRGLLYLCIVCGIILNAGQLIRHITLYG